MIKILLIDNDEADCLVVKEILKEGLSETLEIRHVTRVFEAYELGGQESYDVILLDLILPDSQGLDSLRELRRINPTAAVVILSGVMDEALAVQAVQNGAQDYLVKNQINSHALARAIRYAIERHRAHEQIAYQANYDHLTGLANRGLFHERLNYALAQCNRNGSAIALMFMDLDQFKAINDTFGHEYGDTILKTIANRLKNCIREVDTGVRLGGDEFAILLDQISSPENVATVAQRILNLVAQPIFFHDRELFVTGSLGITIYPWDCTNAQDLLKYSDTAMYCAKALGGNNFQFNTGKATLNPTDHRSLDLELKQALTKGEFLLYYQPQLDLRTDQVVGMEALLRWDHPHQGVVPPGTFIPRAEENGLILPIGEWVLRNACLQAKYWQSEGFAIPHIAVNLSARQVHQKNLAASIAKILQTTQLDPQYLHLELTENLLIQESKTTVTTLRELKAMGVKIFIDDFGVGYASLRYLKTFPLDGLKLDQSLIHDITTDPNNAAIVQAILALANTLGLQVIAEGIETQEQSEFLREHGCNAIQGFWLSKPLPADQSGQWLPHACTHARL